MQRALRFIAEHFHRHRARLGALEILKYIGPGFLVTVGFIDPGNWAANVAAGSGFGYSLLWMVTLSTIMLIFLQHDAAHLGIVTGLCISEAATKHFRRAVSLFVLTSAVLAAVATALAELLGAAIGLQMLFGIPLPVGAALTAILVGTMVLTNSYRKIERWIIGFVALIGLSFLYEILLCDIAWGEAVRGWVTPALPFGALPIVMSVLGAVVMPHNLFLHSEVIQSRQWNLESDAVKRRQIRFAFADTLIAMIVGWAINSAMILVAAAVFFSRRIPVTELQQAEETLRPLLGSSAAIVFAVALLAAGIASSVTAGLAGGSIFAGIFSEPFDVKDSHTRTGIVLTLAGALVAILFVGDPFKGLIWSQVALSIQLPVTILTLIFLTSSRRVMGRYKNALPSTIVNGVIAAIVIALNLMLLHGALAGRGGV